MYASIVLSVDHQISLSVFQSIRILASILPLWKSWTLTCAVGLSTGDIQSYLDNICFVNIDRPRDRRYGVLIGRETVNTATWLGQRGNSFGLGPDIIAITNYLWILSDFILAFYIQREFKPQTVPLAHFGHPVALRMRKSFLITHIFTLLVQITFTPQFNNPLPSLLLRYIPYSFKTRINTTTFKS